MSDRFKPPRVFLSRLSLVQLSCRALFGGNWKSTGSVYQLFTISRVMVFPLLSYWIYPILTPPVWQSFTWLRVNTCIFEGDIWRFTLGIPWVLTHSQWGIYQRPHRLRNWWDRSGSAATRTRAEGLKSSNGHGISWGYDLMFHRSGIFGICEKPYCHRLCCFCAKQCRIHWAVTFLKNKKREFLQTLRSGVRRSAVIHTLPESTNSVRFANAKVHVPTNTLMTMTKHSHCLTFGEIGIATIPCLKQSMSR